MTDAPESEAPEPVADTTPSGIAVDDLVVQLRDRVQARREAGEYAPDLEAELDAHFQRIVHHRENTQAGEQLKATIAAFNERLFFDASPASTAGNPASSAMHKAINKALARNNDHLYGQLHDMALVVREALAALADGVTTPTTHRHGEILNQLDAAIDRLDSYERTPVSNEAALGDLRRRVEALEAAAATNR